MLDFLRDPVAPVVIGVIGVLATLFIFRRQTQRKSLSYDVITSERLMGGQVAARSHTSGLGELKLFYRDTEVTDAHFVVVRIKNDGNVAIKPEDFITNPALTFDPESTEADGKVLDMSILDKHPDDLEVEVSNSDPWTVELRPTLLNAKDWLKVRVLIRKFEGNIQPKGRIVGVKKFGKHRPGLVGPVVSMVIGLALLVFGWNLSQSYPDPSDERQGAVGLAGIGGIVLFIGSLVLSARIIERMRDYMNERR